MSESVVLTPSAPTPQDQILGIVVGYWQSRALAVAAELELADLLADGPLSVDVLAAKTQTDALSLFRLMRALESIGIFTQVSPRVFANTPTSELLRKNVPGSQWAMIRLELSADFGKKHEAWADLLSSIRTGKAVYERVHGYSLWQFMRSNPDKLAIFNEAMRSYGAVVTPVITAVYDWNRFQVIADIGGGIGTQLVDILNANPSCRGILFDQPDVVAQAIPHDRAERVGGDFFKGVPPGADAYILRFVIHDWADSEAIAILNSIRHAIKPDARLMLIEIVIPDTPEFSFGKWIDLLMLIMVGGQERTASEYRELYAKAGFELEEIVPTRSPFSIIIGRPHA